MIGSQDLVVGLVIVLVLFGAKKLPELAGSIGKSLKEFKKGVSNVAEEDESAKPLAPLATTPVVRRKCTVCQTALEPEWSHCPRCGASAPPSAPYSKDPA